MLASKLSSFMLHVIAIVEQVGLPKHEYRFSHDQLLILITSCMYSSPIHNIYPFQEVN